MASLDATCWTLIEGAASGRFADRDEFARRYLPAVQAYLLARWKESPLAQERDDAVQEVFVECFRQGGALERVHRDREGGFRAFLYGVARNVARRVEDRKARRKEIQAASAGDLDRVETDDVTLSRAFDRAKHPSGEVIEILDLHRPSLNLKNVSLNELRLLCTPDKLVFVAGEQSANVWLGGGGRAVVRMDR